MPRDLPNMQQDKDRGRELTELARCLRNEKIYVSYEKKQLQSLNEAVAEAGRSLSQAGWIAHMQRVNLTGLTMSRIEYTPNYCCQRSNLLNQTHFVDGYKQVSHHLGVYSQFLVTLRDNPDLVGACLAAGDKIQSSHSMTDIVDSMFCGVYGSCVLTEDEFLVMKVLKRLIQLQLISASNPRKLLRHGNYSLSIIYRAFSEQLFSSKLFLTAALYEPILNLLTDDEIFLDIDPSKALYRFPPEERSKRFGQPGTPDYEQNLKVHRKFIVKKLVEHAKHFIEGIHKNFHRFPVHLANIMRYLFSMMNQNSDTESKDIYTVCVDLLFTLYICPAIADPEPMGIIDMPISFIARFNLMQVGQIIQTLALWKWEEINPNHLDLYSEFDRQTLSSLVQGIIETACDNNSDTSANHDTMRLSVLLTADQLHHLINWLRSLVDCENLDKGTREELTKLTSALPMSVPGRKKCSTPKSDTLSAASDNSNEADEVISPASFAKHKAALTAKLSNVGGKAKSPKGSTNENFSNLSQSSPDKVLVIPIHEGPAEMPGLATEESVLRKNCAHSSGKTKINYVGFGDSLSFRDGGSITGSGEVLEKRTRFSLSHDEGSIGNTSDNLEAISEAASNHSVASSLEDEVDQTEDPIIDNLSDMVSANVSGRGTPNVSGRDTPSSQVSEDDHGQPPPEPPVNVEGPNLIEVEDNAHCSRRKNGEPDMEEKFGRFEIKPEVRRGRVGQLGSTSAAGDRDEAVSMVSDTWSTDVLSSDTETVGEPPTLEYLLRGRPGDEFHSRSRNLDSLAIPAEGNLNNANSSSAMNSSGPLLDIGECGSEAWSMDVLASDTESFRMRDFDPDDSISVARSDDTRFTDDTTRSDPDQLLQRLELQDYEEGNANRSGNGRIYHPVRNVAVEQWAELSRSNSDSREKRRDSDASANSMPRHESILKKPQSINVTNLSEVITGSLEERTTTDGGSVDNFSVGTADISTLSTSVRLSTTSIASSASSQDGSAASVEAIPPPTKSRSNSSVSVATSVGGGTVQEETKVNSMASTGAIPKSISFDKSADKDDGGIINKRDRNNFFKNFKLPKIGRNRGGGRGSKCNDDFRISDRLSHDTFNIPEHAEGPTVQIKDSSEPPTLQESTDDILAKYRKAPLKTDEVLVSIVKPDSDEPDGAQIQDMDLSNHEPNIIFDDAKRKLRLMLSEVEAPSMFDSVGNIGGAGEVRTYSAQIVSLLRVMLAEALNQQDRNLAAQLYETIRSISNLDEESCLKLVRKLKEEYKRRSPYIGYLVKSRQGLLASLQTLNSLTLRMENEQKICSKFLISVCVRLFFERHQQELSQLHTSFSSTSVMDEKTERVCRILDLLWEELEKDPILAAANGEQRDEARIAVERAVFSQIYMKALYPNNEADRSRDVVMQEHIAKLKLVVTPGHKDLKIPQKFRYECPWPSAQAELKRLAAFKLPSDKVHCLSRVSSTIMNLLSLAADRLVPAADDFLPVLVYVIIQANPPGLLSTVQFVDNFYGSRLCGEDQYWWMQFVSAIEFIKTMDYQAN